MIIKRVGVLSIAKVAAILYGALGLIIGLVIACVALLGAGFAAAVQRDANVPSFVTALFGVGAVVLFPILYAAIGFVFWALGAWLFNVAAGMAGGVEIETQP